MLNDSYDDFMKSLELTPDLIAKNYKLRRKQYNSDYSNKWNKENKERLKSTSKIWRSKNKQRINNLKKIRRSKLGSVRLAEKYGIKISKDDYCNMVALQNNRCKICKNQSKLLVDHCHMTNKIRGLLCNTCNLRLGFYEKYKLEIDEYLK